MKKIGKEMKKEDGARNVRRIDVGMKSEGDKLIRGDLREKEDS